MKLWIAILALACGAAAHLPATASNAHQACEAKAAEKKLYGAARNSFINSASATWPKVAARPRPMRRSCTAPRATAS